MEFNIRGILDENGQLQSVQSSCSNTPLDGLPFSSPFRLQGMEVRESKVVDYAVKKELDRKLYAKVNEMSDMMIHLKHVQDSLDISKKLNKEYEEKIHRMESQIAELKRLNKNLTNLVKEHNIPLPDMLDSFDCSNTFPKYPESSWTRRGSSSSSSGTIPKTLRTSTTEITIGVRHSEIDTIDGAHATPAQSHDPDRTNRDTETSGPHGATRDTVSEPTISNILVSSYVKPKRPNKLEIPKSFKSNIPFKAVPSESVPQNTKNNYGENQGTSTRILGSRGLNSVDDKDICSNVVAPNDESRNKTTPTKCPDTDEACRKHDNKGKHSLQCDEEGYLILMLPTNKTVLRRNKATRRKTPESPPTETEVANGDPCSECHCDTDVHVRWIDFHNCRNSCGSPISKRDNIPNESPKSSCSFQPVFTEVHETLPVQSEYVEIPDCVDEVFSSKEAANLDDDKDLDDKYIDRAPAPLPRDLSENIELGSPCSPNVEDCKDSCYLSSESRKLQDKPNNVLKTMRMTSEWHSAKKELLRRCHTCTSQDAENTLGTVVKKSIRCFQSKLEKSRKRNSKNLSEKLVEYIKESLVDDHEDDVITMEFLQKVVQLCEREFQ